MSVTGGGRSSSYDDLEVENVEVTLEMDTGNDSVGSNQQGTVFSFEPLGGLSRGEAAELVAVHETMMGWAEDQVAAGHQEGGWEVSFDSSFHLLGPAGDLGDELTQTSDLGDFGTGIGSMTGQTIDPDILRFLYWAGDNSSGVQNYTETNIFPYRQLYGAGPTVDRHDEIFYHAQVYTDDDMAFSHSLSHQYIWDVFEI